MPNRRLVRRLKAQTRRSGARSIMVGRTGMVCFLISSIYSNHTLTHTYKITACIYCRRSVSYSHSRSFSTTSFVVPPLPPPPPPPCVPHFSPWCYTAFLPPPFFQNFSGYVDGKTDSHDATAPMTAYDLRLGKASHWIGA